MGTNLPFGSAINGSLNLVLPVASGDAAPTVFAYHTPISSDVFRSSYRLLAATKAVLASKGLYFQMDAGPRIASLVLRDEGLREAEARGLLNPAGNPVDTIAPALLGEIKRLTTLLVPGAAGYDLLPVDTAISSGKIDEEDWSELEAAIVFFTCHCAMARKADRTKIATATASLLKGSATSLVPMEYVASLPTSTTAATIRPIQTSSLPV